MSVDAVPTPMVPTRSNSEQDFFTGRRSRCQGNAVKEKREAEGRRGGRRKVGVLRDVKDHSIESDLRQEEIPVIAIGLDHAVRFLSSLSCGRCSCHVTRGDYSKNKN